MRLVQFGELFMGFLNADGGQAIEADRLKLPIAKSPMGEKRRVLLCHAWPLIKIEMHGNGEQVTALRNVCGGVARCVDKGSESFTAFMAGRFFYTAGYVDAPGIEAVDRFCNVLLMQTAGNNQL